MGLSDMYWWYQKHSNELIGGAVVVFAFAAALYYAGDRLIPAKRDYKNNVINVQQIEDYIRQGNYDDAKWLINIVRSSTVGKEDPANRVTNSWANELSDIVDKH